MPPLDFEEFLTFKKEAVTVKEMDLIKRREEYVSPYKEKIEALLAEYIVFGGYPAVALAEGFDEKNNFAERIASVIF